MSRFFSEKYLDLEPYTPGEQPRDTLKLKLNTNESPYPPAPGVTEAVAEASRKLNLYSDPECRELRKALAENLNIHEEELIMANGSDDVLNFAFQAFCDDHIPAVFPDITYGFYPVFAQVNRIPYREIPLRDDLTLDPKAYDHAAATIFIANPNAPTGIALGRKQIEEIVKHNPYNVVVVDEAYVDFGGESCIPLIREHDNLLVIRTFSKSRSLAGGRLGFGAGQEELIRDLNSIRYSTNPYNVNSMTAAAGKACLKQDAYNLENCRRIMETREETADRLRAMGFEMTESSANFLFVRHEKLPDDTLYQRLRKRGILIRRFGRERIRDYSRITIGTPEQMRQLLQAIQTILEEKA